MKKTHTDNSYKLTKYMVILCFFFMLLTPSVTLEGAKTGLMLWFNQVIPSLLPSIIISNLIISLYGSSFKNPYLYVVFAGLICGYPLGASATVQLTKLHKLKPEKMQFLMAVCNNSSPMFITNYIIISQLNRKEDIFQILAIIYLPLLLLLLLITLRSNKQKNSSLHASNRNPHRLVRALNIDSVDASIMSGFEIVTKVGGYIILFSIIVAFIQILPIKSQLIKCILSGFLELTTGIHSISMSGFPIELKKLLACVFTAFGGLSCAAQTYSVISQSRFSIKKYIYHKSIITVLTLITAYFMIYVL